MPEGTPVTEKRISVTHDNKGYINDLPLLKLRKAVSNEWSQMMDELARLSDVFSKGQYTNVVFVGQVLPSNFFYDDEGNHIGGYLGAPFASLVDAYNFALAELLDDNPDNRVLILCYNANTAEKWSVPISSSRIDILGLGTNLLGFEEGFQGSPHFEVNNGAGGFFIDGFRYKFNNAPFVQVNSNTNSEITFRNCHAIKSELTTEEGHIAIGTQTVIVNSCPLVFENCSFYIPGSENLVRCHASNLCTSITFKSCTIEKDVHDPLKPAILINGSVGDVVFSRSEVKLATLIYSTTSTSTNSVKLDIASSIIEGVDNLTNGHSHLVVNIFDSVFKGDTRLPLNLESQSLSVALEIKGSRMNKFVVQGNSFLHMEHMSVEDSEVDLRVTAGSIGKDCLISNVHYASSLTSSTDKSSMLTTFGNCFAKVSNCMIGIRMFYSESGVFAGCVTGGCSRGLNRLASIVENGVDYQCVLRNTEFRKQLTNPVYYPDVTVAQSGFNLSPMPVILQGVHSDGIILSENNDLSGIPNAGVFLSGSAFNNRPGVDQPVFPNLIDNEDTYNKIMVSGVSHLPIEEKGRRQVLNVADTLYTSRLKSRFGALHIGGDDAPTIIHNGVKFDLVFYARLGIGQKYTEITHNLLESYSSLTFSLQSGIPNDAGAASLFPLRYEYMGDHTFRIYSSDPDMLTTHLDFVVTVANFVDVVGSGSSETP